MNEVNIPLVINIAVVIVSLTASFFPMYWMRTHNHDYKDGFRLVLPALVQSVIGCVLFGIVYVLRLANVVDDNGLQAIFRPIMSVFLLLPFTITVSLHYWKK